ncbi:hypothetical protein ACFXPY_48550 [Streptomyces sp. NPDC059153]|uniref:hypothetical protein n=1 Tax=Streptomyces sp. NPDC059153 TaxID=3346743 RepID=UPI00367C3649
MFRSRTAAWGSPVSALCVAVGRHTDRARQARDGCGLPASGRVVLAGWHVGGADGSRWHPVHRGGGTCSAAAVLRRRHPGATAVPPVAALPKTEGIRLPPASLLAANARVQTS